ncbi:MAG: hypothetical protein LBJ43_03980 [Propionibacteriaceae bacterium]|jgi:hypothetical protein|nr:hypothetical protein [Propionibacteriaceae bacterium]
MVFYEFEEASQDLLLKYRIEAARLVIDTGRPIVHVAHEIGVGEQLLGKWIAAERARSMSPVSCLRISVTVLYQDIGNILGVGALVGVGG